MTDKANSRNFKPSSLKFASLENQSRRIKLLYLILLIAVLFLTPMAVVAWVQGSKILAGADAASTIFLLAVFFYQRKTHNDTLAINAGIGFCAVFYLYLYIYGGVGNSAFLWLYTFPLFASFLLGSRKGLYASLGTFTIALIYFLISRLSTFHLALYSSDLMIRFFASYLVIIMFSYVAEKIRETSYTSLNQANQDLGHLTEQLTENNQKLSYEIDEKRKIEHKLLQEKLSAEKANRSKSEFLANMSHELRTPLNHIIGFTDLLSCGKCGPLNETQSEYLGDILGSSRHLLSLINDILDLAKVEAGKMELEIKLVDIPTLLDESLRMVREKALKHQIKTTIEVASEIPAIMADERKIKQVLFNLLANATKFTPDGGMITITAEYLSAPEKKGEKADLNPAKNGAPPELKISVKDSGIGLKPENLGRVFHTFEQVESSNSRRFQGTGLGLALTRNFIELHGGRIWAESAGLNRGATFSFTLPYIEESWKL